MQGSMSFAGVKVTERPQRLQAGSGEVFDERVLHVDEENDMVGLGVAELAAG